MIFCLFYVQNEISQIAKNPAIARFFNYQKPLSIRISGLSERHYPKEPFLLAITLRLAGLNL